MANSREVLLKIKEQQLKRTNEKIESRHIHGNIKEIEIDGQCYRMIYYPSAQEKAPLYIDIHGGGFCWGMMEEGDLYCHRLNEILGFHVLSPEYPLTPQAMYPKAIEWLYKLVLHIYKNAEEFGINSQRIIVGGRSAGGNLAAALALLAKDRGEICFYAQVLDHPWLDLCHVLDDRLRYQGEGTLPGPLMEMLAENYATIEQRKEIYCTPLKAGHDQLIGVPKTIIQTCELDSLQIDGEAYARKLQEANIPVIFHCYPNASHGFTETEGPQEEGGIAWLLEAIQQIM